MKPRSKVFLLFTTLILVASSLGMQDSQNFSATQQVISEWFIRLGLPALKPTQLAGIFTRNLAL